MDADAPLDAVCRIRRRVALGHLRLHCAGATQRIDGAAELIGLTPDAQSADENRHLGRDDRVALTAARRSFNREKSALSLPQRRENLSLLFIQRHRRRAHQPPVAEGFRIGGRF